VADRRHGLFDSRFTIRRGRLVIADPIREGLNRLRRVEVFQSVDPLPDARFARPALYGDRENSSCLWLVR
jgi:hypothetical protein